MEALLNRRIHEEVKVVSFLAIKNSAVFSDGLWVEAKDAEIVAASCTVEHALRAGRTVSGQEDSAVRQADVM